MYWSLKQRSANLLFPGCTSVLREYLTIFSSQTLPSLHKDAWWCKEDNKMLKNEKVICQGQQGWFPKYLNFSSFSVRIYVSCRRFIITIWCFSTGLEHSPPLQRLFGFHSTQKLRYRAGRANHSNWRAEVSLHWTWFKFSKPTQNNRHNVYN